MAEDTTYLQNLRGAAAQASACFENKLARDPVPKEEVAYALLTRALIVARTTAEAQRDTLLGYTTRHGEPATSPEGGSPTGSVGSTSTAAASGSGSTGSDKSGDDDSVTIFGREVTNTFTKLANSDNPAKTILDDCIPCLDRALDMDLMAPLDDLLFDLESEFDLKLDELKNMWAILNSDDFYQDLCHLLDFFSFMCIPDLVAILSLLIWYYQSLITSFQIDISGSLWSLIGMMIGPMITSLESLIDQYIQMIMAPIDCIITMLLFQMSKIPQLSVDAEWLQERARERDKLREQDQKTGDTIAMINEWIDDRLNALALEASPWYQSQRAVVKYSDSKGKVKSRGTATPLPKVKTRRNADGELEIFTSDFDYEPSSEEVAAVPDALEYLESREKAQQEQATIADVMSDAGETIRSGLGAVGAYLIEGRDRMDSWFETLKEELRGFLFDSADTFSLATSLATSLKRLARIIGFVKAIIRLAEEGLECGPGKEISEPDLVRLLQAATADDPTVEVIVEDDGTITIVPISDTARMPPHGQGLVGRGGAFAEDAPLITDAERESTTIILSDCVNKVELADLRKVEAWIKELSK